MFGYIAPWMEGLEEERRKRYRAVYCGICRKLGELSGQSGRLLLSHDMTFLAVLLSSLEEPEEEESGYRCAIHPVKERITVASPAVSYAAEMNLFLADLKCEDQIRDEHSGAARRERRRLAPAIRTIREKYPEQTGEAEAALEALWEEEKAARPDPDRLCNLSGRMLGAVFAPAWVSPFWTGALRALGAGLGRAVYWMDAWEDREADAKKGLYNPIGSLPEESRTEEEIRRMLEMMIGEACDVFEALPLEKDMDILRNILYSGVWQRFEAMRSKKEKKVKKT
ncbi:MAG: hypothetical protein IKE24_05370 [Clostridia bacterium]|nr:hypothetical protein [Clostridia bacterium]